MAKGRKDSEATHQQRPAAVLRLVPKPLTTGSDETIDVLARLYHDAVSGRLRGCVFAASYADGRLLLDATGEPRRRPVLARGMVAELDDAIARIIGGG